MAREMCQWVRYGACRPKWSTGRYVSGGTGLPPSALLEHLLETRALVGGEQLLDALFAVAEDGVVVLPEIAENAADLVRLRLGQVQLPLHVLEVQGLARGFFERRRPIAIVHPKIHQQRARSSAGQKHQGEDHREREFRIPGAARGRPFQHASALHMPSTSPACYPARAPIQKPGIPAAPSPLPATGSPGTRPRASQDTCPGPPASSTKRTPRGAQRQNRARTTRRTTAPAAPALLRRQRRPRRSRGTLPAFLPPGALQIIARHPACCGPHRGKPCRCSGAPRCLSLPPAPACRTGSLRGCP